MAVTCFLETPENARARGKELPLITTLRRRERLGQGSPHTRHPAVGQRLRPLGPPSHFSQRVQCLAFCLLCKTVWSFLCTHGERNALCCFICAQVGFLILSWGMSKEGGTFSSFKTPREGWSWPIVCLVVLWSLFCWGRDGKQVRNFGGKLTFVVSFRSPPPPTSPLAGIAQSEAPIRKYRFLPLGQ